eukprot:TRINITY_DN1159_c1_g1_i1.p1 TRINITY_DN1159_c1_g1~~TRINITY_DN1159_c1_g1_i1.p1  ORF type:complete len:103 (-),score=11.60 TRINITY_DN1159_c1_g1_i1:43-351(-)
MELQLRPWNDFFDQDGFTKPNNIADRLQSNGNYYLLNYVFLLAGSSLISFFLGGRAYWLGPVSVVVHAVFRTRTPTQVIQSKINKVSNKVSNKLNKLVDKDH